jgi:predicted AAA+ superfamily ATPase
MSVPDFVEYNPWWLGKKAIDEDQRIIEWEASHFKWTPHLGETFDWDLDIIYVLRGPRQVGKTTLVKLKIRERLDMGIEPRQIFYYPCDLVEGPDRLVKIITSYQDSTRRDKQTRLYIVLDEISSVKDWQKGVKLLYDSGRLKKCTLILTGSHSIDLRKATETLARRRGEVEKLKDQTPDKILLPPKFSEYADVRSQKIHDTIRDLDLLKRHRRHQLWAKIMDGTMPRELEELQLVSKEALTLFLDFLVTGGIPKVVDNYISVGSISKPIYEEYVSLLLRDIARWGGKDLILGQIVRRLVETLGTNITLNRIREETDVSSHNTTGVYLDFLKDSFVTTVIRKLDINKDAPVAKDSRKVHFEDPFIFHALRSWALGREPYREALHYLSEPEKKSKLVESVVSNHLVRLLYGYHPSSLFDYTSLLFHWESSKQRQLDFAVRLSDKYLPIEVKYQNRITSDDANSILDFQKTGKSTKGLIISKDSMAEKTSHIEIPAHLALLLI